MTDAEKAWMIAESYAYEFERAIAADDDELRVGPEAPRAIRKAVEAAREKAATLTALQSIVTRYRASVLMGPAAALGEIIAVLEAAGYPALEIEHGD